MGKIKVVSKVSGTYHPTLGELVKGAMYEIDEEDFGDEIFEKNVNRARNPSRTTDDGRRTTDKEE